ncbi:MAG TPA: GNAT family N-acetyltransferase [Thermomicrobiales bacterium]|nr:GNAT family N-acetyltransferase [Thermomicrobiales bacterium]
MHMNHRESAIAALALGFAALERPLRPVQHRLVGKTPYLFWSESGRRGDEFTHEFYAIESDPAATMADIATLEIGSDHLVAVITEDEANGVGPWLMAGYAIGSEEPIMLSDLNLSPATSDVDVQVEPVATIVQAEAIATSHAEIGYPVRSWNQALLDDPQVRYLQICADGMPVCVGKIALIAPCAYITDIVTLPTHRKQGLAGALMRAMEAEARAAGIGQAVLTASAMGRHLYASLGYETIAHQTLLYRE